MKIKKLKKLSQKLFSLLLIGSALSVASAYAEPMSGYEATPGDSTSYNLSIQVPDYFSIVLDSSSVLSASTATITNNGNTLTLGNDLSLIFNIKTSDNAALFVSSDNMIKYGYTPYLVFAKDGATESAISNCYPGSTTNNNPNAIAFSISANTPTATEGTAPTVDTDSYYERNNSSNSSYGFWYQFTPGSSTISLTVDANSVANTYGANDTKGEYTASITVTQMSDLSYL